jgi:hypothetical protein
MNIPTDEDYAAVLTIMGGPTLHDAFLRSWDVPGSTGLRRVEERIDTKNGGTYLYCPCPSWKFQGQMCKHTIAVKVG